MKKLYTAALAAIVAFSAVAERQFSTGYVKQTRTATIKSETIKKSMPATKMKAPAKAASASDVESLDIWNYYGLLENKSGEQQGTVDIKIINSATGEAKVSLMNDEDFTVKATFDAAKGTLTIPNNQYLFTDNDGDIYFYLKDADASGNLTSGASAAAATVGTLSGTSLVFPESDIWAFGTPDKENLGWYILSEENEFTKDSFVSLGYGQFTENIIYPLFTGEENKTAATVEVFTDGEGFYKVTDPFQTTYSALKVGATSPDLVLDATDPSNVNIAITSTGLSNQTDGLYTYFSESWYIENYGEEGEVLDEELKITKTVEGDNVTITIPYRSTTIMTMTSMKFYYGSAYKSTLTFKEASSGIGSVEIEDTDAPAVYYNLQGVRVENPSSGIVIRVQGGKATKVIIK